jgi:hypothetical protein
VQQLDLFLPPREQAPPLPPEPSPVEEADDAVLWTPVPDVLPGQLHLFSDRAVRLERVRAALAEARVGDAHLDLVALCERYPDDAYLRQEAARAKKLHRRFEAALALAPEPRAAALLALARAIEPDAAPWGSLRRALHRRIAAALSAAPDGEAELEGQPPGFYLIEAGAPAEAKASLEASIARRRSARALFLLADVTWQGGAQATARRLWLEALLLDPFDDALAAARDDAVRALPDHVRYELEIDDEPAAWAAPAGIVSGVLPSPVGIPADVIAPPELASAEHRTAAQRAALEKARAFVGRLVEAAAPGRPGAEAVIETRRAMKAISPALFRAYLERGVRSR